MQRIGRRRPNGFEREVEVEEEVEVGVAFFDVRTVC